MKTLGIELGLAIILMWTAMLGIDAVLAVAVCIEIAENFSLFLGTAVGCVWLAISLLLYAKCVRWIVEA